MTFIQKLKQPFPCSNSYKSKLGMAAFFGSFTFLFLLIFQPFDINIFSGSKLLLVTAVYGFITFSCIFFCTSIGPLLLPQTFHENSWTTGKQILLTAVIMFLVGLSIYLVSPFFFHAEFNLYRAVWFQGITVVMGIIPVFIFVLLRQNRLLKKFKVEAEQLEKKLQEKQEVQIEENQSLAVQNVQTKIILTGDYQNETIEVYADDLYLITSASNYIKVYHLQKEKLIYSIIRSTLTKAEETVIVHPNFLKCQRAFIINLDKVVHVEGNAQGYKVKIEGYDELVPVSRNLNQEFSDKLLAFRKEFT